MRHTDFLFRFTLAATVLLCSSCASVKYSNKQLAHMSAPSRQELSELIRSMNKGFTIPTRMKAAQRLGLSDDPVAIEALARYLVLHREPQVSHEIGRILACKRDVRAVPHLVEALENRNWEIVQIAEWVLGTTGELSAAGPLIRVLTDKTWKKRVGAAWALGKLRNPKALPALIDALGDEQWRVRWAASWALGELGYSAALHPLVTAMKEEPSRSTTVYVGLNEGMAMTFLEPHVTRNNNFRVEKTGQALVQKEEST